MCGRNLRFFEKLPRIEDFEGTARERLESWFDANAALLMQSSDFLWLHIMLAMADDVEPAVQAINTRIRQRGLERLTEAILPMFRESGLTDA